MDFLAQYICVCCLIVGSMASSRVQDFFPSIHGNLSKVTWAHAVNNKSLLESTLKNAAIMMIEADVSIGTVGNETNTPIMAHPPNNSSDLSLSDFLREVSNFNEAVDDKSNTTKKGVKLDFKSTSSLEKAVENLKTYTSKGMFPIWINADIIPGPINSTVEPVDATKFFELTKDIRNIVLSVGWTTNYGPNMTGKYDKNQIDLMVSKVENVTNEITFPVRAGLAAESADELERLLKNVTNSTLTLWSSENDLVNVTNLNKLLSAIGGKKVYIDVPESLRSQLHFHGNSDSNSTSTTPIHHTTVTSTTPTSNTTIPTNTTTTISTTIPTNTTTTNTTIPPHTTPHNNSSTTKAPNNGSGNMLKFGTLTLLFGVTICLL